MKGLFLLLAGGLIYVGANLWLDSYREHHAAEEVSKAMSSPGVINAQLDGVEAATLDICEAKGYSAKRCHKILSNPYSLPNSN